VAKQIEFPQGYPPPNNYKFSFDYHEVKSGEIQVPIKGRIYTEEQVNQILKGVKQQCEETITKTIIATLKIMNIESELQKQLKERDERIMQVITSIDLTVKDLESNAISAITSSSGTKSDLPSSNEKVEQTAKDKSTNTKAKKSGSYVESFIPPESVERTGDSSNYMGTPNSYNGPLKLAVESASVKAT
jgi:recombinational DNA repair protein RecT